MQILVYNGASGWLLSGQKKYRDSIFKAFKRKETFATTGTRIAVRFFGVLTYQYRSKL